MTDWDRATPHYSGYLSRGYSQRVVEHLEKGDPDLLGVQLGRACIARNIPFTIAARKLGVSKQTLYGWVMGNVSPALRNIPAIEAYIKQLA